MKNSQIQLIVTIRYVITLRYVRFCYLFIDRLGNDVTTENNLNESNKTHPTNERKQPIPEACTPENWFYPGRAPN